MVDASKEWSDAGWAEAGHSQSRQDLLCTQTWQGTAQHLLPRPQSPQHIPSPVREVPAPDQALQHKLVTQGLFPS